MLDDLTHERLTGVATKLRTIARVIELRRNGQSNREIAELLNLHENTVGRYLAIILPPRARGPLARRNAARLRREVCASPAR